MTLCVAESQLTRNRLCSGNSYSAGMKTDTENITSWVQETFNELFQERLIPFELTAQVVSWEGREYVVSLHDNTVPSVRFSWTDDRPFKEVVRAAVLDREQRIRHQVNSIGSTIQTALTNYSATVPIARSQWLEDRIFRSS